MVSHPSTIATIASSSTTSSTYSQSTITAFPQFSNTIATSIQYVIPNVSQTGLQKLYVYIPWKHQLITILEAYSLIKHIDGSTPQPSQFLLNTQGNPTSDCESRVPNQENQRINIHFILKSQHSNSET